jgi:hypothetical protein
MSLARTIAFGDFELSTPLANHWLARNLISTPLGSFGVELAALPDEELISTANDMIALLEKEYGSILNRIYGLYQLAAENKRWMKDQKVPTDLEKDQLAEYIDRRFICVRRDPHGHSVGAISMRTKWDSEHRVSFGVRNGRLVAESP